MSVSTKNHKNISELFKDLTYFDQYGTKVMLVSVLLLVLFVAHSYVKNMQRYQPIRDNWSARRCDADVIPLAGFINTPEGQSMLSFTNENFQYCVSNILKPISDNAIAPFDYMMAGLLQIYNKIMSSIMAIRSLVGYIRSKMATITKSIYNRLVAIVIPIQEVIIRTKDLMGKVVGIMEVGLNTALSTFLTLKALLAYIASASANVLVIGAMVIGALGAAITACFFFCQPAIPYLTGLLINYTIVYCVIMVMLVILIVFIRETTGNSGRVTMFDAPKCFDGKTLINLANGSQKEIQNVELGDVLEDGGRVTSKMKLTSLNERIYEIGNVVVSGRHSIDCDGEWVRVCNYPGAKEIIDYSSPYLYCLNTTTKVIHIGDYKFIDWDEVFEDKEKRLRGVCGANYENLSSDDNLEFIHQYFDGGIIKNTPIVKHGSMRPQPVQNIEIGDILQKNIEVYGIVQIDLADMRSKKNIVGLTLLDAKMQSLEKNPETASPVLYHLLTSSGYFYLNNRIMHDYNNYIDAI